MTASYTYAVLALIADGVDIETVLRGLKQTLAHRGHDHLYHTILRRVARQLAAGTTTARIVVADNGDVVKHDAAIKADCDAHSIAYPEHIEIDPTLTGGYILETGTQRIDRSYKRALTTLYESITQT